MNKTFSHTKKCETCKYQIDIKYDKCYNCTFQECTKCKKNTAKKPYETCYPCYMTDSDIDNA